MRQQSVWSCILFLFVALFVTNWAHASPIKLKPLAVTASSTYSGTSPNYAVDGNVNTVWNAGLQPNGQPYPWIKIDLGRTTALRKIRFLPAQTPNGYTSHMISVGQTEFNLTPVATLNRYTYDNKSFEWECTSSLCGNARFIQISTGQSPSWVAWREIDIYQNVEYLGYFPFVGESNGGYAKNYVPQTTAAGANFVMIGGDLSTWPALMTQARNAGAKVAVDISAQVFGPTFRLLPNDAWITQWNNVLQQYLVPNKDIVVAVYPLDEPYNHAADETELRTLADRIRSDTKSQLGAALPVATIFAITEWWDFPASHISMFDWVGFDCYSPWNTGCRNHSLPDMLTRFKSKLSSRQRMIAVPWSFRFVSEGNATATQYENIDVINHWQREILADPNYIAVVPFLWQSGEIDPGNSAYGTVDLPLIKERLYQFTRTVLKADSSIYPLDYVASATYSGSLPFYAFDRITSNQWNAGRSPEAWLLADFGGSTRINYMYITYAQSPAGQTTHIVEGCNYEYDCVNNNWSQLSVAQGYTQDGTTQTWTIKSNVRQIRIRTTQSPSWVAWKEIKFSQ